MFSSPKQLKDWINNMAKRDNLVASTVLQNYMMERLLERISVSRYRDNLILKGGFLIAAMVGIDIRSTMDMDTTIKGMLVNQAEVIKMLSEIIAIDVGDNVVFEIVGVKNIHDVSDYDDFRVSLKATFFTIVTNMKIDITTGDLIIPREIEYSFKLMFEDRHIAIKAYNLNTILAEKIESVLARNVTNTRARDLYDIYILMTLRRRDIDMRELRLAIRQKAEARNSVPFIENYRKHLADIRLSTDIAKIWTAYCDRYPYAQDISLDSALSLIEQTLIDE